MMIRKLEWLGLLLISRKKLNTPEYARKASGLFAEKFQNIVTLNLKLNEISLLF